MARETITTRTSTTTSKPSSDVMTIRLLAPTFGKSDVCPRLLLLLWAAFMFLCWILLIVAFSRADWIEGTEAVANGASIRREVGLFEQCDKVAGQSESCYDVGFGNSNIEEWYAAGVMFVLGMLFLTAAIILALVASCAALGILVPWAKGTMSFANLFFIIGAMLYPIGFEKLDQACDGDRGQCGLLCTDPSNDIDYFILCSPYELGDATYIMVAALIILYISACLTICIRVA